MRVISGSARGTKLNTIETEKTRPTLDRVKENLFNIINSKLLDSTVLDLFAGSGALAIEALSRGAKKAYLCDQSVECIRIIKQNLEKTKLLSKAQIYTADYKMCIEKVKNEKFDVVFIDPPYKLDIGVKAINMIIEKQLLKEEGIIILETDEEERDVRELEQLNISIMDIRKYGRIRLIFIRPERG